MSALGHKFTFERQNVRDKKTDLHYSVLTINFNKNLC